MSESASSDRINKLNKIEPSRAKAGHHRWSDDDDIVALYLSLYGDARLPVERAEIAKRLGMSEASLRMRERNFQHLHRGEGGLAHVARRSRRVFETFKGQSEPDLRDRVRAAIARG